MSGPIPECSTHSTWSYTERHHGQEDEAAIQEEMDERVKLDLPPDEAIKLIMETGEHPEDEDSATE